MKRIGVMLVFILCFTFVFAEPEIHNSTINSNYPNGGYLQGFVNVTFENENVDLVLRTNKDHSIEVIDWLRKSDVNFSCSPGNCLYSYNSFNPREDNTFEMLKNEEIFLGFVLEGENISVENFNFNLLSDFGKENVLPLSFNFLDNNLWEFNNFSEDYGDVKTSCYNNSAGVFKDSNLSSEILYCSEISVRKTPSLRVGAYLEVNDNKMVSINLYNSGGGLLKTCDYNPSLENFCEYNLTNSFFEGDYLLCVKAKNDIDTKYVLKEESNPDDKCGFVPIVGFSSIQKTAFDDNYGLFYYEKLYNDFSFIDYSSLNLTKIVDSYLEDNYNRNCSKNCVLPFSIRTGVEQDLTLNNIQISYLDSQEEKSSSEFYDINQGDGAVFSYDGVVNLLAAGFQLLEDGKLFLYFDDLKFDAVDIELSALPKIIEVFPLNQIPAGISVKYVAEVDTQGYKNITYYWSFGNFSNKETKINSVEHLFEDVGEKELTVTIKVNGLITDIQSYSLNVIEPDIDFVWSVYYDFKDNLVNLNESINSFSGWEKELILERIKIQDYESNLNLFYKKLHSIKENDSTLSLLLNLYSLEVPKGVYVSEEKVSYFSYLDYPISEDAIDIYSGGNLGDNVRNYVRAISNWQGVYIDAFINKKTFNLMNLRENPILFSIFSLDYTSTFDKPCELVIPYPYNDFSFEKDNPLIDNGTFNTLKIREFGSDSLKFAIQNVDSLDLFFTPDFSELVIIEDIIEECNFNSICERNLGESIFNCKNDCNPIKIITFLIGLILSLGLGIYTLIQYWYTHHYEKTLFDNFSVLKNIYIFIYMARQKGVEDDKIRELLLNEGWTKERIDYAFMRMNNKTILPEIIPISKINNFKMKKFAKKKMVKES